jgi:arsenate reductase
VGSDQEQRQVFTRTCREIKNRLDIFSMLPFATLSRLAIQKELIAIGRSDVPLL